MAEVSVELALLVVAVLLIPLGLALAVIGLRRRRSTRIAVGVGCLLLSGVLWWRTGRAEFWVVDRCLDRGGRYDYQTHACVFE